MESVPFLPHLVTYGQSVVKESALMTSHIDLGPGNRQNRNERKKCVLISSFYNYDMLQVSGGIAGLESS